MSLYNANFHLLDGCRTVQMTPALPFIDRYTNQRHYNAISNVNYNIIHNI